MSDEEAISSVRTFTSALRPGLVLAASLVGGVLIGRRFDMPVEGLAGGLVVASVVNGVLAWNDARDTVS